MEHKFKISNRLSGQMERDKSGTSSATLRKIGYKPTLVK